MTRVRYWKNTVSILPKQRLTEAMLNKHVADSMEKFPQGITSPRVIVSWKQFFAAGGVAPLVTSPHKRKPNNMATHQTPTPDIEILADPSGPVRIRVITPYGDMVHTLHKRWYRDYDLAIGPGIVGIWCSRCHATVPTSSMIPGNFPDVVFLQCPCPWVGAYDVVSSAPCAPAPALAEGEIPNPYFTGVPPEKRSPCRYCNDTGEITINFKTKPCDDCGVVFNPPMQTKKKTP